VSATLSAKGDVLTLFAVNSSLHDATRPLDLTSFGDQGRDLSIWTLQDKKEAGEPDVANSFGNPKRVAVVASKFKAPAGKFVFRFPKLSLTVLELRVRK
jgi:hypothetical protein